MIVPLASAHCSKGVGRTCLVALGTQCKPCNTRSSLRRGDIARWSLCSRCAAVRSPEKHGLASTVANADMER